MNKFIAGLKSKILSHAIKGTNLMLVDANTLVDMRMKSMEEKQEPLSREHLTMKQLGSYIPNFETLDKKPDSFKNAVGLMCRNLMLTEEWQYLVNHLKQDQVNLYLFDENRKDENYVRGSINGIYVVDDMVNSLGSNYEQRLQSGEIQAKGKKK